MSETTRQSKSRPAPAAGRSKGALQDSKAASRLNASTVDTYTCECDKDEDEKDSLVAGRTAATLTRDRERRTRGAARKSPCPRCSSRRARALRERLGNGRELPRSLRGALETAFGKSLDGIRVHTGARAAEVCAEHDAAAVTFDRDIAFAADRYRPGTPLGQALIAHEVAHVLERRSGSTTSLSAFTTTPARSDLAASGRRPTLTALLDVWRRIRSGTASAVANPSQLLAAGSRLSMTACGTSDPCKVTGSFSSIPSGNVPATLTGNKLGATFDMIGVFQPAIDGCNNCACGEYRQYVKGSFKANGAVSPHRLCGTNLSATYQEDCVRQGGTDYKYGYRNNQFATSRFTPDQATGCTFRGHDEPGITGASGDILEVDLGFKGQLIDTCDGNKELALSEWTVKGTATLP